jgi:hypothetical protein
MVIYVKKKLFQDEALSQLGENQQQMLANQIILFESQQQIFRRFARNHFQFKDSLSFALRLDL